MANRKEELEAEIAKAGRVLAGGMLPPALIDKAKEKKARLEAELKELLEKGGESKAEAKAEVVKVEKAAEKVAEKHASKKKSAHKPAKKVAAKKKEAPAAKKKSEHIINKERKSVTINGVEYGLEECDEAKEAWEAHFASRKKSQKKFVKKSSGEVLGDKLSSVGEKVLSSIPKAEVEKKPKFFIEKLDRLSKLMTELATLIDEIVKNKETSKEVKVFAAQIKEYVKKISVK